MNITFNTAKLAKEKGFNEYVTWFYFKSIAFKTGTLIAEGIHDEKYYDGKSDDELLIVRKANTNPLHWAAPTQSELQKWLRDKHRIYVDAFFNADLINSTRVQIIRQITEVDDEGTTYNVWKKMWENRFALDDDKNQFNLKNFADEDDRYKVQTYTYEEALEQGLITALNMLICE